MRFMKEVFVVGLMLGGLGCGTGEAVPPPPSQAGASGTEANEDRSPEAAAKGQLDTELPQIDVDWSSYDVFGLTLGMTIDEVTTYLSSNHPELKLDRHDADIGNIVGSAIRGMLYDGHLTAIEMNTHGVQKRYGQRILGSFTPPPNEPRLVGIYRMVPFEQARVKADLKAQLIEKYGKPLYEEDLRLSWSVDSNGVAIRDRSVINQCNQARSRRGNFLNDLRSSDTHPGPYANCGFTFMVILTPSNNPELINGMNVLTYDVNFLRKTSMEAVAYSQAEAEKLREKEMEQAREQQGEAPRL